LKIKIASIQFVKLIMKNILLIGFLGLFCSYSFVFSQNAGLSLTWNGTAYVVKMDVVTGANPLFLGSSQISIVTPSSVVTSGIVVTCVSPCLNPWNANTFVNAPAAAPSSNFIAIATLGGNMGNVANGSAVTLFTFTLPGGCNTGVRLFDNINDPNSSQMPGGQDFKNTLVNGLVNFEFYNGTNGNNVVCTPAPLDLLRFTANLEGENVRLDWATENEINVSHFEVQRSLDGVRYAAIGRKDAFNLREARYDYLDEDVPDARVVYYRLHQYDLDNAAVYSPVRMVRLSSENLRLSVSPNPAARGLKITIGAPEEMAASVQIHNAAGVQMYSERHTLQSGSNEITLAVTDWPEGTYVVSVQAGTRRNEQRFIVQH
jgi:Secretion system C-terminal sorting domain